MIQLSGHMDSAKNYQKTVIGSVHDIVLSASTDHVGLMGFINTIWKG